MRKLMLSALALAAIMSAVPAHAVDFPVPTQITLIKTGRIIKFLARPGPFTIPSAGGDDDPTIEGGSITVADTGNLLNQNTYLLPSSGWVVLTGSNPGFKYRGTETPGDPCTRVLVRANKILGICKGSDVTFVTPLAGPAAATLRLGTATHRYCFECGGTVKKNDGTAFKAKLCPPPGSCAVSPSGAFLDESSPF